MENALQKDANYLIVQFNFCPLPLDKKNIIKANVEIADSQKVKEALKLAIRFFNSSSEEFSILEDSYLYKIRLSKRSGLPDMDLPSLNENLSLKELNHLNFSVIIESSHISISPSFDSKTSKSSKKYEDNFDAMSMKSINLDKKKDQRKEIVIKNENELVNSLLDVEKKKKGCCHYLSKIFK